MATKPTVGGSYNVYGTELNAFLDVGHDSDGTLKKSQALTDMGWSPTTYAGGESVTYPNGLIVKAGITAMATGDFHTFGTAFPNALISVVPAADSTNPSHNAVVRDDGKTGFRVYHNTGGSINIHWIARGY